MNYDVIIIGSGLGGLTAGAKLSKAGKKVLLLEQHNIPGGCATTYRYKKYKMEVSLHEMDGLNKGDLKNKIFNDLDVFNNVTFLRVPEFYRFVHGETDFIMPDSIEESVKLLKVKFPDESNGIEKFFKVILGIYRDVSRLPRNKFILLLCLPIFPILFKYLVKYMKGNLGDFLDSIIKNEELKLILCANLPYYHDDPYSMSLLYFSAAQGSYFTGGGHFIQGGSQVLSSHLADVIEKNGGEIKLNHLVTKITTENNRATGVEYIKKSKSGSETFRDSAVTIIANASIPVIADELLSEPEASALKSKIINMKIAPSIFTVYIRFNKTPASLGNKCYSTFVSGDDMKTLRDMKTFNSNDFGSRSFGFVDYSQLDSQLAEEGKSVGTIVTMDYFSDWDKLSPEVYKEKKDKAALQLIDRLNKIIPGIKDAIEGYDAGTPVTLQNYTLNREGTAYGFAQIPEQSGMYRMQAKSDIKNLYFASAWTTGGGFTGAILGGYFCAEQIL